MKYLVSFIILTLSKYGKDILDILINFELTQTGEERSTIW
jgi:hypothetical protein